MFLKEGTAISIDTRLSGVILSNPYLMLLLDHFEIELPIHEKTIAAVCAENKINAEFFLSFVNLYMSEDYEDTVTFSHNEILSLIKFLKKSHNYYVKEIYPNIQSTILQMSSANNHKEMGLVKKFFNEYYIEVTEHLSYENEIVFPYITELYLKTIDNQHPFNPTKYSVSEYKEHHDDIEVKLNDLRNLLIKYLPAQNDQLLRRKLLFYLFELEYDLRIHSRIEDLILIPMVAKMELNLSKSN